METIVRYNRPLLSKIDKGCFGDGLDLEMMYREMYWASDGYFRSILNCDELDIEKAEQGFKRLLEFWKSVYLKKG